MIIRVRDVDEDTLQLLEELRLPVFLPRPLPGEKIRALSKVVEVIYMPPSTWNRLSKESKDVLKGKVRLLSLRGRRGNMSLDILRQIISLRRGGASIREISRALNIPKSSVHYALTRLQTTQDLILSGGSNKSGKEVV